VMTSISLIKLEQDSAADSRIAHNGREWLSFRTCERTPTTSFSESISI